MAFYQNLSRLGSKYLGLANTFKWGFNLSPMYRRTTARIVYVSNDLLHVTIKLPINYKNRNYVGTIFGGSMFSAVDPIPMVQLINLLNSNYVVWDKSAEIYFKRPGNQDLYADFQYTKEEIDAIIARVKNEKEILLVKTTQLTNKDKTKVFCEVKKTIYIAEKQFFKEKRKL
ncbi:DUF4442 domain-containing protein [Sphingobacteriaceae bacterium WQ 2009]|uniref:DUF4442 domain-containing protein n=1 Tax=Rhinopithecimicrobium faecis TaxID=2820698 RepID=A0A8T4HAS8_9SPHI|nr:DUF4442 domain-containing protein [Sphingobacteriaceae bacterium WQ 2009]